MTELDPYKNIFGHTIYRDRLGREIEADGLELLLRDKEYRIVKQEQVNRHFISTVWLGVPHGCPPTQYFETMVFLPGDDGDTLGESCDMRRYETLEQAEQGHSEVVQEYTRKS